MHEYIKIQADQFHKLQKVTTQNFIFEAQMEKRSTVKDSITDNFLNWAPHHPGRMSSLKSSHFDVRVGG